MSTYRSAPQATTGMPPGIPYIVANEAAERFSYYGMRTILVIFMTKHLLAADGSPDPMSDAEAKGYYHLFSSAVYFFPVLGALLSDAVLGKYRTIIALSVVYCLGHLALALDDSRTGLAVGLSLIAIGSGGIKPCVSAHVGDQFGKTNVALLSKVFSWFYFSINLGAFVSTLLTPWLLVHAGPHVAFGVPGGLMLLATIVFWTGRNTFIHVPPGGLAFLREAVSGDGLRALMRLGVLYLFVAVFWSLYDQTGSAWVLQASNMNLNFLGVQWLPSQIQAVNPILVMALIPVFTYWIYPLLGRLFEVTALRKIALGLFVTAGSFLISAWIETRIAAGFTPSIGWQFLAYVVLTAAEVMVSITCLEFSYTQAPRAMKSLVMALFLMSVSLGNIFTSAVNFFIAGEGGDPSLEGASYYLFFAGLMFVTAIVFVGVASRYREVTYLQQEA